MLGFNPTLDNHLYVCDVEARVFGERIYLYGTYGKTDNEKSVFHVFSSADMKSWTDHGVAFGVDDVKWIKTDQIWAPDCVCKNDKYYLYYSIPSGELGVAVSDKPQGPFHDLGKMKNVHGIDASVLIDDGQAYLYWGQLNNIRAAKLNEDMLSIDESTLTQPLSVQEHEFHEGGSVRKINEKYYYVYTDTHRRGKSTAQGYAVSNQPLTGFTYKNIIVDSFDCDPQSWNNHGCIQQFKGQWYIFYHRATHAVYGWGNPRQLCIEKISLDENGEIGEVEPTSSGVADSIAATCSIQGCSACALFGENYVAEDEESAYGLALKNINPHSLATYRYIQFNGENTVRVKMKGEGTCRIELYIDGKYHDFLTVNLDHHFKTFEKEILPISGRHILELKFFGLFRNATLDEISYKNV